MRRPSCADRGAIRIGVKMFPAYLIVGGANNRPSLSYLRVTLSGFQGFKVTMCADPYPNSPVPFITVIAPPVVCQVASVSTVKTSDVRRVVAWKSRSCFRLQESP